MTESGFVHRFVPGQDASAPVLLLLHATGGDENDLVPLGQELLPAASLLSLRGNVLENGMPRFFRRLAEGVFDLEDLQRRTDELAQFLDHARERYGLAAKKLVAVGYSNGANIAASLILRSPRQLSGAVLFRPMVPFTPESAPNLGGIPIFLSAGQRDHIVPAANTQRLAAMFEDGGAQVSLFWHKGGHELGADDLDAAKRWLARQTFLPTTTAL
jgi:predicted esterase